MHGATYLLELLGRTKIEERKRLRSFHDSPRAGSVNTAKGERTYSRPKLPGTGQPSTGPRRGPSAIRQCCMSCVYRSTTGRRQRRKGRLDLTALNIFLQERRNYNSNAPQLQGHCCTTSRHILYHRVSLVLYSVQFRLDLLLRREVLCFRQTYSKVEPTIDYRCWEAVATDGRQLMEGPTPAKQK